MDDFCYICYENQSKNNKFLKPYICKCKNLRIHESCFLKTKVLNKCSVCKEYYQNIYVKKDKQILNIVSDGYYEKYKVNRKNKITGLYTGYYPNEKVLNFIFYKNGNKHGIFKSFYENGNIQESGFFKNNLLEGPFYTYYSETNSNPKEYKIYNQGILNGTYIKKYENGNIMLMTSYKNSELHGNFSYLYPNGDLCISTNYEHGLIHGRFRAWKPNYELLQDIIYDKGEFIETIKNSEYYIKMPTKTHFLSLFLFLIGLGLLIYVFLF